MSKLKARTETNKALQMGLAHLELASTDSILEKNKTQLQSDFEEHSIWVAAFSAKHMLNKESKKNLELAKSYFEIAADAGNPEAQHQLSIILLENKHDQQDIQRGISLLQQSADAEHSPAITDLAYIFLEGKFTTKNQALSSELFKKSAEMGDINADYMLGEIYYYGLGTPRNIKKSIEHFQRAANQHCPNALYFLSEIFLNPKNPEKNYDTSHLYLYLAAKNGHKTAINRYNISIDYGWKKIQETDDGELIVPHQNLVGH